ncbi:cell division septal protein FtsQ [Microterricola gilva]|uniref:Cell division septal protein FtsQ n=1 Tax=Microterricola gilva TaxID=393267 RepID=A0A4Q8AMY0_9MICO|nr:FtsQ-type POTRA domain-containing protein [Microterricola gilva]RZU65481.1 cell division septal protein FtsQ [Microterricola gilva]
MKRPQGFEPPAAPAAPARQRGQSDAKAATKAPAPKAPIAKAPIPRAPRVPAAKLPTAWWMNKQQPASAPAAAGAPGEPDAVTEPIAVQGAQAAQPASTGPLAPVTEITSVIPGVREEPEPEAEQEPEPLTPGSARARLRAATKARRAYERAEVRRFTRHLRRRRAAWLTGLGAVLALAIFVAVGTFSPLMALTTIQVEGTNRLLATDVSAALGGQIGTPLPLVDLGEVKSDLSQFSLIQSFSTESRPPNTLVVRIVERTPIGAIAGPSGFDLVDAAGVVIQTTPERPEGFPVVEAAGAEGLAAAGSVVQALPDDIRPQVDVVRAASTDDVSLGLVGGASVAWGSAEESALKALVLSKLMAAAPPGTVSVYDVSSPASPVVR